jgi:GNAT superfamily N-acetyltransferase
VQPVLRDVEQASGIARMNRPLCDQVIRQHEVEEVDAHLGRGQSDAMAKFTTRLATLDDARAVADVFSPSFRLLTFLPMLHTVEEDRRFIENVILRECVVTVAVGDRGIVSFLARHEEEIRLLHTHPDFIGAGAGSLLLEAAKESGKAALELWSFQANTRARRFYERHGFRAVRLTDGRDNEEKMPDVRYRWECRPC